MLKHCVLTASAYPACSFKSCVSSLKYALNLVLYILNLYLVVFAYFKFSFIYFKFMLLYIHVFLYVFYPLNLFLFLIKIMISVTEFLQESQPGRRSKLDPFRNDIFELKKAGRTNKQIQQFLMLNGVSVTENTVRWFCINRSNKKYEPFANNSVSEKNKSTIVEKTVEPLPTEKKEQEPAQEPLKTKSNWTPPPWAPKDLNLDDYI